MKMGVCNRLRGSVSWIPASAGMTEEVEHMAEGVSKEVPDASRRESHGVCASRAIFALPESLIEGVERGGAL